MNLDYAQIPPHMFASLQRYLQEHKPVGGFLTAVITNDLREAVGCADDVNIELIPVYVAYLYNNVPGSAWGSVEKHRAWLEQKPAEVQR